MDEDVPLLVPEVNAPHAALIPIQRERRGYSSGFIATNPNCSAAGLVVALKPIEDAFGIEAVSVVTMQALSGAGYPGVASLDAVDNVIPYISGEEEKLEAEPRKILGRLLNGRIADAEIRIGAQCHRVPVIDGHLEAVSLKLRHHADPQDVEDALREFSGEPQRLRLPSAPVPPIEVRDEDDRPQTRLDRNAGNGMAVVVGRVRKCKVLDIRFVLLSHNLVRGAAGAALLNAELLAHAGYISPRTASSNKPDRRTVILG
jgi:aspartate-semialdehyde dehydrogenase